MARDAFYVADSGGFNCSTCALGAVVFELEHNHYDPQDGQRRLLAAVRLHKPTNVVELLNVFADARYRAWSPSERRDSQAANLLYDVVAEIDLSNGDGHEWGEHCDGCNTELVEMWVSCSGCGTSEYHARFNYDDGAEIDPEGESPTVEWCELCADENGGGTVLLEDDGRGYVLRFVAGADGGQYRAGCRRFTLEQALAHWGDPRHGSPRSAAKLFGAVLTHAMHEALPGLASAR